MEINDLWQLAPSSEMPMLAYTPVIRVVTSSADDDSSGTLRQILLDAKDGDIIAFALASGQNTITLQQALQIEANVTINGANGGEQVVITAAPVSCLIALDAAAGGITLESITLEGGAGCVLRSSGKNSDDLTVTVKSVCINSDSAVAGSAVMLTGGTVDLVIQDSVIAGGSGEDTPAVCVQAVEAAVDFTGSTVNGIAADASETGTFSGVAVITGGDLNNDLYENAPAEVAPLAEAPVEESPAEVAPLAEAPAEESPAEVAPLAEAPVEESLAEVDAVDETLQLPLAASSLVVTSSADDGSAGTLRQVLAGAQDGDTITFNLASGQNTITLQQALQIGVNVTINGANGDNQVVITAASASGLIELNAAAGGITLENLTLTGGTGDGGALRCSGGNDDDLTIIAKSVKMTGNSGIAGGAVVLAGGTVNLTIQDSVIDGSTAENAGGAVYVKAVEVSADFTGTTISGSAADTLETGAGDGGAVIIVADKTCNLTGAAFSGNTTGAAGGALWNYGTSEFSGLLFNGNEAGGSGGAVFNAPDAAAEPVLTVTGSTFSGNRAGLDGGAICNDDAGLIMTQVLLSGNTAAGDGGALYNESLGEMTLSGVTFSGNTASGEGSALCNLGTVSLSGGTFLTASDTVVNRGTLDLGGVNIFVGDLTNYDTVNFTSGSTITLLAAAKMVNDAAAAAQTVGDTAFLLDRTPVRQETDEFCDVIWQGDWGLSDTASYRIVIADGQTVSAQLGTGFEDVSGRTLWFGQGGDSAGITDHVKLNSGYTATDFQKFSTRESINESYTDYNAVIEITGGTYDYDLFADSADFEVTGKVQMVRESGPTRGRFLFGGGSLSLAEENSVTVCDGGDISVDRIVGGSIIGTDGDYTTTSSVEFETGSKADLFSVYGGNILQNGAVVTLTGDVSMQIDGDVYCTDYAVCGDLANNYSQVTRVGETYLDISGGTFVWVTAGGGMVGQVGASYTQQGSTHVTITGGTFEYGSVIFGGCASNHGSSGIKTTIDGDTNVLVDVSAGNTVSLGSIYAGSNGAGAVTGDTSVTFTGLGDNLTFNDNRGGVSGDSACSRLIVSGNRALHFQDYSGKFDAPVVQKMDEITFSGSTVTITSDRWKASPLSVWDFDLGSSLDWAKAANNSFAGDTLTFGADGDTLEEDWEVIVSTSDDIFSGLDQAAKVTLLGQNAGWDGTSAWVSADYRLSVNTSTHKLIVAANGR